MERVWRWLARLWALGYYLTMGFLIALTFLGGPAVIASLARTTREAYGVACVPGAFGLFSVFRLWDISHDEPGGCGLGAGIVFFCALFCGLSTALTLIVAFVRHQMSVKAISEASIGPGLTPEP